MDTLYDLLGALPKDEAEALRVAFRKAVKGVHPDLRPDDPDAAMKFRQIVRANEILLDRDQRAVYDHLLVLAQHEKDPAAAHPIAARVHKIASTVLALTSLSIVTAGGYFLFMHMSMALVAPAGLSLASFHMPASTADLTSRLTASIAAVSPSDAPNPAAVNAFIAAKAESSAATSNAMAMAPPDAENAPPSTGSLPDQSASVPRPRDMSSLIGDISGGADPNRVTQLDQKLTAPYVSRGILFFRDKKDDRPFPELAPLKRTDKLGHPKSVVVNGNKPHADGTPTPPKTVPVTRAHNNATPWYTTATNN
jgi:DnaJ domain